LIDWLIGIDGNYKPLGWKGDVDMPDIGEFTTAGIENSRHEDKHSRK
jgi:hypothetical protein